MKHPRKPTAEECTANAPILCDHGPAFAAWYPQMGGYRGLCVVVSDQNAGEGELPCFDVYVWHDGEFPFGYQDDSKQPVRLHHCNPEQFVNFGKAVIANFAEKSDA